METTQIKTSKSVTTKSVIPSTVDVKVVSDKPTDGDGIYSTLIIECYPYTNGMMSSATNVGSVTSYDLRALALAFNEVALQVEALEKENE